MKKTIIIIVSVVILAILAGLAYYFLPLGQNSASILANIPNNKSTQKDISDYAAKVASLSESTDKITIKDCRPDVSVARMLPGGKLTVSNGGDKPYKLTFGKDKSFTVETGKDIVISSSDIFSGGREVSTSTAVMKSYGCEGLVGPSGFVMLRVN